MRANGKPNKIGIILAVILLAAAPVAAAQDEGDAVLVTAFVDRSEANIGDKITYTIEIDADDSVKTEFPDNADAFGGFVVKDFGEDKPRKSGAHRQKRRRWYLLDTYTTGSYVIPPRTIQVVLDGGVLKQLKTPEIFVEIKSLLEVEGGDETAGEKAVLRDIKPPLTVPGGLGMLLIAIGIFLLIAGLIAAGIAIRRRLLRPRAPTPKTAHELALEELDRIEALRLPESLNVKEFTYLVSGCMRLYIENRYGIRAPEQTTEEFMEYAAKGAVLDGDKVQILREYMERCDLVKYAEMDMSPEEGSLLMKTTRKFINETRVTAEVGK